MYSQYKNLYTVPEILSPTFDIIVGELKRSKSSKSQNSPMYGSRDIPILKWKFALNLQWICSAHYKNLRFRNRMRSRDCTSRRQVECNSL